MPANADEPGESAVTTAEAVADYLLWMARERGEVLTNLKLQKLLYYAQAWYLALRDRPLFADDFQAWIHGPVLPSQHQRFRANVWQPIMGAVGRPELPADVPVFLDEILDVFGVETAIALELMTHRERPWIDARAGLAPDMSSDAIIPKDSMKRFYRAMPGE